MKISDMLKVVDKNWVRKPKGFRVRFQRLDGSRWVTDYMPDPVDGPLESAVVAWRSAWKLQQASRQGEEEFANLTVVDDLDNPVRYYATGHHEVFNPMENIATQTLSEVSGKTPVAAIKLDSREKFDDPTIAWEAQPDSDEEERT
jgi:hypothetical protein